MVFRRKEKISKERMGFLSTQDNTESGLQDIATADAQDTIRAGAKDTRAVAQNTTTAGASDRIRAGAQDTRAVAQDTEGGAQDTTRAG